MVTASLLGAILAQTTTEIHGTGLAIGVLIFIILSIVIGLAACVAIGWWAGAIARDKGKSFGTFFALGFIATLCGLLPGILVVVIVYVMEPEGGAVRPGYPQAPYGQPQQPYPQQPYQQQPYQPTPPPGQPYNPPPQPPYQPPPQQPPPQPPYQPPGGGQGGPPPPPPAPPA